MRENKVEAHFCRMVELTGGIQRKAEWIGRRGCPDRWCGWPSTKRTGWVETKGTNGRLSELQLLEHARLRSCGEQVDVLWSIDQVDQYISEMAGINIGQLRAL